MKSIPKATALLVLALAALAACTPSRPASSPAPVGAPSPAETLPSVPSPTARPTPAPSLAPSPVRYVAVGASDSVGVGASDPRAKSWPALLAARLPPGSEHRNVAVTGSTVAQALGEQLPRTAASPADVVTVWLAVNDLNARVAPAAYGRDLRALLDGILGATTARVFVGNVPDLTAVPVYGAVEPVALRAAVQAYNAVIADVVLARAPRAVLVDLLAGSEVIARELVVAPDGFHPNDRGYELIAERFAGVMRAHGVPLR